VRRLLGKLAKGGSSPQSFVVAFGGHSSAASHGNYFNESYAHEFERLLAPVFKEAGIQLEVRNHAMGGTASMPTSLCIATFYGAALDMISWDFGMTEGANIDHSEFFFRQALLLDSSPLLLMAHNSDFRREPLLEYYSQKGFEVGGIRMDIAMDTVPATESSDAATELPHAIQFLNCGPGVKDQVCRSAKYDCVRQCGDGVGQPCPGQVSWHPGWRYHKLKGSLLATIVLEALQEAATRYQTYTMEMGPDLDPELYSYPSKEERPLPPSFKCGSMSLDAEFCDTRFSCATTFEPHVGQSLQDLVEPPPQPGRLQSDASMSQRYHSEPSGWQVSLAPGEGDNTIHCTGHLDAKKNILGRKGDGWLVLRTPKLTRGLLLLCEGPFSARMAKKVQFLNTSGNTVLEVDGQRTHFQRKVPKSLCSVVSDGLSPATHTVAFKATEEVLTGFSFLVWA